MRTVKSTRSVLLDEEDIKKIIGLEDGEVLTFADAHKFDFTFDIENKVEMPFIPKVGEYVQQEETIPHIPNVDESLLVKDEPPSITQEEIDSKKARKRQGKRDNKGWDRIVKIIESNNYDMSLTEAFKQFKGRPICPIDFETFYNYCIDNGLDHSKFTLRRRMGKPKKYKEGVYKTNKAISNNADNFGEVSSNGEE